MSKVYTKEEIEFLKKPLPKDPCFNCHSVFCGDCHEGERYKEKIIPYFEKGLFDIASRIDFIKDSERRLEKEREELNHLKSELPVEIFNEVFKEEIK